MKLSEWIMITLSVLMLIPLYLSTQGISYYILNPEDTRRMEALIVVVLMIIFSSVIYIPYLGLLMLKWKSLNKKVIAWTLIPFVGMIICAGIAEFNGVPW